MKITHIGHAAILIETQGLRILSDPWWRGPCFGAQWWAHPVPQTDPVFEAPLDYIYISHGHHDHFHPGTMAMLDKRAKVLIGADEGLASGIRELGFDVIEIASGEVRDLGHGVRCRIEHTGGGDTWMGLEDGHSACLNLNDALHSSPRAVQDQHIALLKQYYPQIDYVFCGFGTASHFPNCYSVPGKDKTSSALRRQQYFNRQWVYLIDQLAPRFGFPFAADVMFFEDDLFWTNEAVHNGERPTTAFQALHPDSAVQVVDIAPGFAIDDGHIVSDQRHQPVSAMALREERAADIARANTYGSVSAAVLDEVVGLLRQHLNDYLPYLADCAHDYRFLIAIRSSEQGIKIEKTGRHITIDIVPMSGAEHAAYHVICKVRLSYLKWALTRPYGDEVLFVGSGCVIEYTRASDARKNLHRELIFLLRRHAALPKRSEPRGPAAHVKRLARQLLRKPAPLDLYDLSHWTVFA